MQTKMSIFIVVNDCVDSRELYEELRPYRLNVIDIGSKALVHAIIDIRDADIENIVKICKRYGDCEIDAHLVNKKDSD